MAAGPSGKESMDLKYKQLRARVERLQKLSAGLYREELLWKKSLPATLYVEQEAR
jgi:hypothetical protein